MCWCGCIYLICPIPHGHNTTLLCRCIAVLKSMQPLAQFCNFKTSGQLVVLYKKFEQVYSSLFFHFKKYSLHAVICPEQHICIGSVKSLKLEGFLLRFQAKLWIRILTEQIKDQRLPRDILYLLSIWRLEAWKYEVSSMCCKRRPGVQMRIFILWILPDSCFKSWKSRLVENLGCIVLQNAATKPLWTWHTPAHRKDRIFLQISSIAQRLTSAHKLYTSTKNYEITCSL